VDLGVGDTGVVVDDGVNERRALVVAVSVAGFVGCGCPVLAALGAFDIAPAATVGEVAQLLDVDGSIAPG
jgi:hypothetical protein